ADLPALYQMAEVFVYPSRFEGFGIPLLEALCSGTPAIGCTGSCLEEAGGPSSLYVNPDDAPALAAAIDRVLSNRELKERMIADGHTWADRFQPAMLTHKLMWVYGQIG
ncbi:MAG: glycosyltransferase, partial [Bacteroidaceae bacterium]|nr:glycosyltransferase [Bacteroidaceae bacterium]